MKKKKPFEPDTDYVKVHRAIHRLYTRIPDFTAEHASMYVVLMDYYRSEYGYAYPTKWDLAHDLHCGENKPSQLAKVLERCGLIKVQSGGPGRNDRYYVYAPITDEREFYARFPEALEYYEKRKAGFEKRRARHRKQDGQNDAAGEPDGTPITAADL